MARVTPEQAANKWRDRLSGAGAEIQAGVMAVTESPGAAAARSADLWLQKVTASKPKWVRRVSAVTLQDWQQAMVTKGLGRIQSGAQAAQPKVQSFMSEFLPYVDQGVAKVKAMPKGTVEAGIARAGAMIRHNAGFVRKSS